MPLKLGRLAHQLREALVLVCCLGALLFAVPVWTVSFYRFGINKVLIAGLLIGACGLAYANVAFTNRLNDRVLVNCAGFEVEGCVGMSEKVRQGLVVGLAGLPIALVGWLALRFTRLRREFELVPFYYPVFRQGGLTLILGLCALARVVATAGCVLVAAGLTASGFIVNVEAGREFFVSEVRGVRVNTSGYLAFFCIIVFNWVILRTIKAFEQAMVSVLVSQWFFCRTKLWIRKTFSRGLGVVGPGAGSWTRFGLEAASFVPIWKVCAACRAWADSIEFARPWQIYVIQALRPLLALHEHFLKARSPDSIAYAAIMGTPLLNSGYSLRFLYLRQWGKIAWFDGVDGNIHWIFKLFFFNSFYLVSCLYMLIYDKQLLTGEAIEPTHWLLYWPFIFSTLGFFLFGGVSSDSIGDAGRALVICIALDEEMFQGKQRFIEMDLKHFVEANAEKNGKAAGQTEIKTEVNVQQNDAEFEPFVNKMILQDKVEFDRVRSEAATNEPRPEESVKEDSINMENQKVDLADFLIRRRDMYRLENERREQEEAENGPGQKRKIVLEPNSTAAMVISSIKKQPVGKTEDFTLKVKTNDNN